MSTFRGTDSLLDGKTSDQLTREVAAREGERAQQHQRLDGQPPRPAGAGESPCEQDAQDRRRSSGDRPRRVDRMSQDCNRVVNPSAAISGALTQEGLTKPNDGRRRLQHC
jgi:hypothetical protein